MKTDVIQHSGVVIAKIMRNCDWPDGLTFYTTEKDFVQVSTWNYNSGKHLKAHSHKISIRQSDRTQEVVFVKSGAMTIKFFSEKGEPIKDDILSEGDVAIIYSGGHSYDIVKDKTQIFEVKNGPYPGLEKDKHLMED